MILKYLQRILFKYWLDFSYAQAYTLCAACYLIFKKIKQTKIMHKNSKCLAESNVCTNDYTLNTHNTQHNATQHNIKTIPTTRKQLTYTQIFMILMPMSIFFPIIIMHGICIYLHGICFYCVLFKFYRRL